VLASLKGEKSAPASLIALFIAALVVGGGALSIPRPTNTFRVAVITDMVYNLTVMQGLGNFAGLLTKTPELSQALFDNAAQLTRQAAPEKPAFVVWSENGFSNSDDQQFIGQVGALAGELNAIVTVDTNWKSPTGLFNTALLIGTDGKELGRRAKINIVSEEADAGILPGPRDFPVFDTPQAKAGIAVCWDVHRLWIMRELARSGAQIILLPMDNDFNGIPSFPPFHAADAVFRAAENHLAFGLGTVNGLSMVIDPYGRITAEGQVNQRGVTTGETFVVNDKTMYTQFGDWFGWTLVAGLIGLIAISILKK
jgi:apolipoprotein N-acyltransferase